MLQALEKAKTGILTNPALQDVMRRAVNLRTDLLDQIDQQIEVVARRLNLATKKEVKALRRQIRELENQVQGLDGQLHEERRRADRAESQLADALKSAREADAKAKKAEPAKPAPKAELKLESPRAEAKAEPKAEPGAGDEEAASDDAPTPTKRSSRAKKKAETEEPSA